MSETVIKVENLSKLYRLGSYGSRTLRDDIARWWSGIRGKSDPTRKVGAVNKLDGEHGEYIWAVKDINFDVRKGEVLGIIGRNGAGKSTLLKILAEVTYPTEGRVRMKGRIAALLEVGTGMHLELTGRENIFLNGAILGMKTSEIRGKLEEIIEFAGVSKYLDTPVKRYSSGMRVRLGFGVAAFLEPEILIVDEVLAVGDSDFQKKAIGKMQAISKGEGRTVLFVSHNLASIENLCEKCILMDKGMITNIDSSNLIISQYLSESKMDENSGFGENILRSGSQDVKITSLKIYDSNTFEEITTLRTGQNIVYEIGYEGKSTIHIHKLKIGLAIFNYFGNIITILNSDISNNKFEKLNSKGKVYCRIDNFPLSKGVYNIKITLKVNNELNDQIDNALRFHVEYGDFYRTGKVNTNLIGGINILQNWYL